MQDFRIHPSEMVSSFWRNRSLITASVKREIFGRYRGSFLGIAWSFFNPLLMLAIYTFVFGTILKARWSVAADSQMEFALVLFAGLITFNLFAESVTRAPSLIVSNPNYVKRIVFPLEILPFVIIGSALFHYLIGLGIWLLVYVLFYGAPPATVLYFPLILLPLIIFTLGVSWMLASLGVFLRDVSQVIGLVTTAMMFLAPVFYPTSSLPEGYRPLLYLNPLTPAIELSRDVLYWGKQPDFLLVAFYLLAASLVAWLSFAWFQKTRKGFADVL
ncbi:ABC transporter permease [Bradyrhizobium liaoningense]|uniref:ABC transporter permease n=1 Tax=Bradyrhizobium liaoningense TaxID=43992 RepID=UPI0004B6A779|nr:ABC transporter permease [Bradyrhizobium liaoningense]